MKPGHGPQTSPFLKWYWACAFLLTAGTLAYANSFAGAFIFDDEESIQGNVRIRQPLENWQATRASGRPAVPATLAANYAISGLEVGSYHAFTLTIHLLAG